MRWYICVGVLVFVGTLLAVRYPSTVTHTCGIFGSYCMYPFTYLQTNFLRPCTLLFESLEKYRELFVKYRALQDEYADLQAAYTVVCSASSYAQDVQKELDWFKKRFDTSVAHVLPVIGLHRSDRQHTMLIEGGTNRNIERDMVVLTDNLLVGKVTTVYPWYSMVQLITDPASCVSVYGVGSGGHGIVRGTGATDTLILERVDHLTPVEEKELLLSSGDGLVVPRGYGVGLVESCTFDGLYYTGRVKIVHDIGSLRTCVVVDRANLSTGPMHEKLFLTAPSPIP